MTANANTPATADAAVVQTIKKLMDLAERAGTPAEAALAAQRMQEFLQRHNLTRAEIESRTAGQEAVAAADAPREKLTYERAAMYTYQQQLMGAIAKNNFCLHFITTKWTPDPEGRYHRWSEDGSTRVRGKWRKVHVLYGRVDNVQATVAMYDYLTATMERLLPYTGAERRSSDARLWLAGCGETLAIRLNDQRAKAERADRERKAKEAQTAGIVRLTDLYATEEELNEDFRHGLAPGTTTRQRLEYEAKERAIEQREKELIESGTPANEAWYLARGRNVPAPDPVQVHQETPSQRRRREEREARGSSRRSGWTREDERNWQRRNSAAFADGQRTGKNIALGGAVGPASRKMVED